MSEQNGHVEVVLDGKTTIFRKCVNRLELSGIASVLWELQQIGSSYNVMRNRYVEQEEDESLPPEKRNEAFSAKADLDGKLTTRTMPLANRLLMELTARAESGTPPSEYDLKDVMEATALYIANQTLSEDERKNLVGGPKSPVSAHPEPQGANAATGSSIQKPEQKTENADRTI